MKPLYLVRNKGAERCRELIAQDPARINYEQKKSREDAQRFEEYTRNDVARYASKLGVRLC